MKPTTRTHAFTLVELLVVIGVIGLLVGLLLPTLGSTRRAAQSTRCLAHLRQIGQAVIQYANDNNGLLPRSTHSAGSANVGPGRVLRWSFALMPYLSAGPPVTGQSDPRFDDFVRLLNGFLRCPADDRTDSVSHSYGKSVWTELRATEPGMDGRNTFWRVTDLRRSSSVVLFGELKTDTTMSDHMMAHFWVVASAPPEVDVRRHGRTSNYLFADGHARAARFDETFDPARSIDLWNPQNTR